jgi:hypothetical protein
LWTVLRSSRWKFTDYASGERELYDLLNDPYELQSQHNNPAYSGILTDMAARLEPMKGLNMTSFYNTVPRGHVGVSYSFQLSAWGGTQPYVWSIVSGSLPAGLFLNPVTGRISGTPTRTESTTVSFMVQGSGLRRYTGLPERFISTPFDFVVDP